MGWKKPRVSARVRAGLVEQRVEPLRTEIPDQLARAMVGWLGEHFDHTVTYVEPDRVASRLTRMCLTLDVDAGSFEALRGSLNRDRGLLVDMIDWLIGEVIGDSAEEVRLHASTGEGTFSSEGRRFLRDLDNLEELLVLGNSAWAVDLTIPGLAQRLSDEERGAYYEAVSVNDPVAEYLREGWQAAWGTKPNGEVAHDKAIKALEAMFRQVVAPNNPSAKLNDIANHLRDKPEKWTARLQNALHSSGRTSQSDPGVAIVESVVRSVFAANYRHAGVDGHAANDLDDGRDAITLVAALIAMQRRGFLTRDGDGHR